MIEGKIPCGIKAHRFGNVLQQIVAPRLRYGGLTSIYYLNWGALVTSTTFVDELN